MGGSDKELECSDAEAKQAKELANAICAIASIAPIYIGMSALAFAVASMLNASGNGTHKNVQFFADSVSAFLEE